MPIPCSYCSAVVPENARFCPQCGNPLSQPESMTTEPSSLRAGWGRFLFMLAVSLGVSVVLTLLFHAPIFIVGAILPALWLGRKR